ncbi:hypothetical protein PIB30_063497 [Stylosanthes scabra]|uniref:Putative plant transposon protein domain-containing protein n=1 Tax=Stylosanthes scabra TaxID=79078 RepID=A0ABU6QM08_9FABA|nr:hypothetical protein [Stylosanthes scabra]
MVWEFCSNFSAAHQTHVFLRGRRIPFTEDDIRRFLDIDINLPPPGENDMFLTRVAARKNGELDMGLVYQVVGRSGTNWTNNPEDNTTPDRKIDNAILNAQATAWHKLIIANIDPKQHGTTFDMNHAILIYVLMTEGVMNLPRIMRDVLLKRPTGNSRNLLPYPVFVARLAIRHQVPEFSRDEFYNVREQDMYCLYGDWKGEQPKVCCGRLIPLPQAPPVQQPEQQPPPPPPASKIPSSSIQRPSEPSLQEIMRHLERQGHQLQNTHNMIRQAFPDTAFIGLMQVSSSEDGSDCTNILERSDAKLRCIEDSAEL